MKDIIKHLELNNYEYTVENDSRLCMYILRIKKGDTEITRHYPYNIANIVKAEDLIDDIESEFND